MKVCSVSGCEKQVIARGYCRFHYNRWWWTGSPLTPLKPKVPNLGKVCSIDGCGQAAAARGMCSRHYQRTLYHGNPHVTTNSPPGSGSISKGYRMFWRNGKRTGEHQLVWEAANGPIPEGLVIHHKNGNPLDNRLENLQLMTQAEHARLHSTGPRSPEFCAKMKQIALARWARYRAQKSHGA